MRGIALHQQRHVVIEAAFGFRPASLASSPASLSKQWSHAP